MPRLSALVLIQADIELPAMADATLALCFAGLALWSVVAAWVVLARVARTVRDDGGFRARIGMTAGHGVCCR